MINNNKTKIIYIIIKILKRLLFKIVPFINPSIHQ